MRILAILLLCGLLHADTGSRSNNKTPTAPWAGIILDYSSVVVQGDGHSHVIIWTLEHPENRTGGLAQGPVFPPCPQCLADVNYSVP